LKLRNTSEIDDESEVEKEEVNNRLVKGFNILKKGLTILDKHHTYFEHSISYNKIVEKIICMG
jgi:hypothetical protein